jgi:hypothetical protein
MSAFEQFDRTYGPPRNCEPASDEVIRAHDGALPAEILDRWREVGWCSYGDGLLWFTNPRELDDVLEDWIDVEASTAPVFLRTAFGHLYFWHEGHAQSLRVHWGDVSQVAPTAERFFNAICVESVQEKILMRPLFEEVKERLGPPARDECYAFVPALALGGPGTADSVQKVKLREHLGILAQLVGA